MTWKPTKEQIAKWNHTSYINNKEDKNRRALRDYHRRRAQAYKVLGDKCRNCGYDNWKALQIDHINGDAKQDPNDTVQKRHRFIINYPEEAEKIYRLYCANCNWLKRFDEREMGNIKYEKL